MGDEANPKPIFISDSLLSNEKEELIALIREYIDVFAWNNEDMPGLVSMWQCTASISSRMPNLSSNSKDGFVHRLWKLLRQRLRS